MYRPICALALCLVWLAAPSDAAPRGARDGCIFGAGGEVLYAPPGADCETASLAPPPASRDFHAPAEVDGPWMPVEAGIERLYRTHLERTVFTAEGHAGTELLRGTRLERFVYSPPAAKQDATEVRITTRLAPLGPGEEETSAERHWVRPVGDGYEVLSSTVDWMGDPRELGYERPARLLPDEIAPGVTWDLGPVSLDGVNISQRGEILGYQDARTPAGSYKGCLVVRYFGEGSGHGQMGGVPYRVPHIKVERTEWHARGVGLVLAKDRVEQTMVVQGQETTIHTVTQTGLQGVREAPGTPAAEPPL